MNGVKIREGGRPTLLWRRSFREVSGDLQRGLPNRTNDLTLTDVPVAKQVVAQWSRVVSQTVHHP